MKTKSSSTTKFSSSMPIKLAYSYELGKHMWETLGISEERYLEIKAYLDFEFQKLNNKGTHLVNIPQVIEDIANNAKVQDYNELVYITYMVTAFIMTATKKFL